MKKESWLYKFLKWIGLIETCEISKEEMCKRMKSACNRNCEQCAYHVKEFGKMYFITCFTKYEIDEKTKIPNIGSSRTFGYYEDRDVAIEAVEKNWCDIQERLYRYAVVEHIPEGLYELSDERLFFEWDEITQQFKPIKPLEDCFGNYAFG